MIEVSEISKRLADRVLDVCRLLLPGGVEIKNDWVCGDIDGDPGKSLHVNIHGAHAGKWIDWANQDHKGDLIDLWRLKKGLSPGEAIRQAKEFLGISEPGELAKKKYVKAPVIPSSPPSPQGQVLNWFKDKRGINPETIERYRVEVKKEGGKAIIFPSFSPTGELINRSYRTLPKEGEDKKVWQDDGCAPCLFGWHALNEEAMIIREVILCEGQIDCMTLGQWGFPALSIPNGGGMTWLDYEFDNLAFFERITVAFDMDDKGREFAKKVVERLGKGRCRVVELPKKDWNECLLAGFTGHDARKWILAAKAPSMDNVIVAADLASKVIQEMEVKPTPFTLKFFDQDWKYQKGLYFRKSEVTAWTGLTGGGKSTFLNFLTIAAACQNEPIMIASMEVPVDITVRRIVTAGLSKGGQLKTPQTIRGWLNEFGYQIILFDRVGYVKQDKLFEAMLFAFQRYGATQFIIDSFMRVEGLEENYPGQGEFLNKLQEFAKKTGAHIHLVAHPGKVKDRKVNAFDIKGSSLILNNVDNAVSVHKNPEKFDLLMSGCKLTEDEEKMHDTELVVEKQRESGWVGSFYLKYNPFDFTFAPCEKYSPPKPEKKAFKKPFIPRY